MTTAIFVREQLRAPFNLALLILIPAVFVAASADVLADFAEALGGGLGGNSASALGAGWAAAFIAGTLGFFQVASARDADRRLVLAGGGRVRIASARLAAALVLGLVAAGAAFVALSVRTGVEHPWHAAAAVLGFAVIYLCVGVLVGSLIRAPLEGSLAVVGIFLLDVFSGPGMSETAAPYSLSRNAAEILIAAGRGVGSPTADWLQLVAVAVGALASALLAFLWATRSRA